MDLISEVQQGIHGRTIKEEGLFKVLDAVMDFSEKNRDAKELLNDYADDGERMVANWAVEPFGRFCIVMEGGKFYYEKNKWRDDSNAKVVTDAKTWYDVFINQRVEPADIVKTGSWVVEGRQQSLQGLYLLWDMFYTEIQLPTGFWTSSVVELEPQEMAAFHYPEPDPAQAIAGLIQEVKQKGPMKLDHVFLVHDKPMFHMDDKRNWHESTPGGVFAMFPIGEMEKDLLTDRFEIISSEGGSYGAIPSRYFELNVIYARWRRFPFIKWSKKFGVQLNLAKQTMVDIPIPEKGKGAFFIDPRGFIEKNKEEIDVTIHNPIEK